MLKRRCVIFIKCIFVGVLLLIPSHVLAIKVNDKLSIGGVIAAVYQYQDLNESAGAEDTGGGALPIQPEISFKPTENDELFAKFGFAAGNGLNEDSPFVLAPWAAGLEDDVKDINGSSRNYLLTAWYKHSFKFSDGHGLELYGGLIDATDYLDENAYSNDEYTQFMNEALVNGPNVFLPSYDLGGALEWEIGNVSVKGVVMRIYSNDDGDAFNFYGLQLEYKLESKLGEGNYRMVIDVTSKSFLDPPGENREARKAIIFSFDQAFGEIIGAWLRIGEQDDKAAVDFDRIYSGGINIGGKLWGRKDDNVGVGYAYLRGGNTGIDKTQVVEGYVRFVLNDFFAVTLDLQYMEDDYHEGDSNKGFIYGVRLVATF